ncbi:hypothetical protein F5Y11DRAFT_145711 [Daldinia sp. FL1419]|nr:hypothetical protein F5Y11DRAFT_145711 [Daldinia sp. FL1419]
MEVKHNSETNPALPNAGKRHRSPIISTSSTEQPLPLKQGCLKMSSSNNNKHAFQCLDFGSETSSIEFDSKVGRGQNEIRVELGHSFLSDDSLSSSKRDDSFSSLCDLSLPSVTTETQDSATSMYRAATPVDALGLRQALELREGSVGLGDSGFSNSPFRGLRDSGFSEFSFHELGDYHNSMQCYQNLRVSQEPDADQPLTISIPPKADYPHSTALGTINGLVPFTSLSEVNVGLSESLRRDASSSHLNSTGVKEPVTAASAANTNLSPRWDPETASEGVKESYLKQRNITRRNTSISEMANPCINNYINLSVPSPLPSAFNSSNPSSLGNSSNVTEYDSTNSSDFEEEINGIDHGVLQPLTSAILDELLYIFYRPPGSQRNRPNGVTSGNRTSQPQSRTAVQKQSSSTSNDSNTSSRGKRRRKDSDQNQSGDEGEDGDGGKYPHKRLQLERPAEVQPTFWACPFSKWKPLSYRKCCQYILKDISRVKQHLRRYHERPPYCPVCWEVFKEDDGFESHIQGRNCSPRPKVDLEGVTSIQQKQLERRSDKQLSKPEQWYAIYTILFPDQPHPTSPYVEGDLSSELLSFQKFMATDGLEIVERIAREHIPPDLMPHQDEMLAFSQSLFQQAIPQILQRYDATRPALTNGPDIPKRSGLSSIGGNDGDSGYGSLSNISQDRTIQNQQLDMSRNEQERTIIDDTGFDWTSINDIQVQASITKSQVTADATRSQDPSTFQMPYESLSLPTEFTLNVNAFEEEQFFGLGENRERVADGSCDNWDADLGAIGAMFNNEGNPVLPVSHPNSETPRYS